MATRALICTACMVFQALLLLPGYVPGQNPPVAPDAQQKTFQKSDPALFSLKINVDLVTVETVVRNSRGDVIGGLQAEDFLLLDNGVVQRVSHFSQDELPLAVALVIDCSGSISSYLSELRSAALSALNNLKPEDQVVLYSFGTCPTRLTGLTEDRARIAAEIEDLATGGSTNINGAIRDAARFLHYRAPDRRRAILLISDNYENMFLVREEAALREAIEAGAVLYSIQTPGQRSAGKESRKSVENIAKETGGRILKLGNEEKLTGMLESAIRNLSQGYTLGFTPSDPGRIKSYHRLEVKLKPEVACKGCQVAFRSGYYVGSRDSSVRMPEGAAADGESCSSEKAYVYHRVETASPEQPDGQEIRFDARASGTEGEEADRWISVDLSIDASSVEFRAEEDRHVAKLLIAVFAADTAGIRVGEEWKNVDLRLLDQTYRQFLETGIPYYSALSLKSPARTVKVVVYDLGSDKLGARLIEFR